jgi:hypothetical protein
VILSKDLDNIKNFLKIDWRKIHIPILIHPPIPLILKSIQKFMDEKSRKIMISHKKPYCIDTKNLIVNNLRLTPVIP